MSRVSVRFITYQQILAAGARSGAAIGMPFPTQVKAIAPYTPGMARRVFYRIDDRPDGLFDAIVRIEPDKVIRRDGFVSLAEVEEWLEGLVVIMAALGVPVARERVEHKAQPSRERERGRLL